MKMTSYRKYIPVLLWFVLLLAAVPMLRTATRVQPADPLPERWRLPDAIGAWQGETIYYSTDPEVLQPFVDKDIEEPGICPISGMPLDTISPAERRLLPDDVEIQRKRYRHEDGGERTVILLISGASREGIHRPEWCLAAQGFRAGDRRILKTPGADDCEEFNFGVYPILRKAAAAKSEPLGYFLYWFEGPNRKTPHNGERILRMGWDRLRHGRIQRWAYLSIQTTLPRSVAHDSDTALADTAQWLANGMRRP